MRRPIDWLGMTLVIGVAAYFASLLRYGFNLGEDGDALYLIYRTFCGQRPYIDFASGYTPGFFYTNAALFHLFGVNVLVIRWALVVVNSFAVFALYRLARLLVPASLAVAPALGYAAWMPVFPGEYAAFNVPYPAWYVVLTWVASTLAFLRGVRARRVPWFGLAGLLAGIGFAFKPNSGAFNLAALVMTLLFFSGDRRSSPSKSEGTPALLILSKDEPVEASGGIFQRSPGSWQRYAWWALLVAAVTAIASVFHFRVAGRDARLLLWPVLAVSALCAARGRRARVVPAFAPAMVALLCGFAVVTVPWMLYYWSRLGSQRFLSDVLFIGSGHEPAFYIPIRDLGSWDAALVAACGVMVISGWCIKQGGVAAGRLVRWGGVIALVAGIIWLGRAPMPEGFVRAVRQQLEFLAFGAALLVHWVAVWIVARVDRRTEPPAFVAIAIGAPLMYLSIYPRADFFHWILCGSMTLVLAVTLYWRVARLWVRQPMIAAVPIYAVLAVLAWPGLSVSARVATASRGSLAQLGIAAAPIVLESGRAQRFDDLRQVTEFIKRNSDPAASLLGFPNLQLVNFLSGRHVPGRYGSFQPGWPDHVVEAEVVNDLHARRTPLIVMRNDVPLFIGHAPLYFFLLRHYVQRHYELAARFGRYDILRLLTVAAAPMPTPPYGAALPQEPDCAGAVTAAERLMPERAALLAPCWVRSDDPELQWRAVRDVQATHDPAVAPLLAQALRAHALAPSVIVFAVRTIGELGDATAVPGLVAARGGVDGRGREELDTALFNIASRALVGRFMFVPQTSGEEAVRADAASGAAAMSWLAEPVGDPRRRFAAAWIAGLRGEAAAVSELRRMLAKSDVVGLQAVAADALIRMGVFDEVIEPLLDGLAHDEALLPSLVLAWCQAQPQRAAAVLADTFRRGNEKQREIVTFITAALDRRELDQMVRAGVTDPAPRVRIAAIWTSGVLRIAAARGLVERAVRDDPTERVRHFAEASLEWMNEPLQRSAES